MVEILVFFNYFASIFLDLDFSKSREDAES